MHYIEDLAVAFMMLRVRVSNFDEKIARSLGTQAFEKRPYTQKQSEIVLRLLKKYRQQFIKQGYTYIDNLLENPVFANPIRQVDLTKHVSLDLAEKLFKLKFPFNQEIVNRLREAKTKYKYTRALWDAEAKIWTLELNEDSLRLIINELVTREFTLDEETSDLVEQFKNIEKNFEQHIPMLIKEDAVYKFKNTSIDFSTHDLNSALVASTKFGIHVFDDTVNQELTELVSINPISKLFNNIDKQRIYLDKSVYSRREMISIIRDIGTTNAVFLYEDSDESVISKWVEDLTNEGVSLEEIAVYFRRKNDEQGIKFNSAVKSLGLNKDATDEKVKWMFFGAKYPKVLIKNKKFADICVCENRYVSTHHSVINTMKNSMFTFYHNDHPPTGDEVVKL